MPQIAVAVADAQRLFAQSLSRSLQEFGDLDIAHGGSTTGREIVSEVGRRRPDVALIDFWISDMDGPAAARAVLKVSPSTRVLFLTEFVIGPVQKSQMRAAGALWYLDKGLALRQVVDAIRAAAATPAPPEVNGDAEAGERVCRLMTLTTREIEVLQILRSGRSPQEVADELSISAGTVKNHIHKILVKTKTQSQVEAMVLAEDEGFISRPVVGPG